MILDRQAKILDDVSLAGVPYIGPGNLGTDWGFFVAGGSAGRAQTFDMGAYADAGRGAPLFITVRVTETFTSGAGNTARIKFVIAMSDDINLAPTANTIYMQGLPSISGAGAGAIQELPYTFAGPSQMSLGATYFMQVPALSFEAGGNMIGASPFNSDGTAKWRRRYLGLIVMNTQFLTPVAVTTGKLSADICTGEQLVHPFNGIWPSNFKVR